MYAKILPVLLSDSSYLCFREKNYNSVSEKSTVLPNKIFKTKKIPTKSDLNHQQIKKSQRCSLPSGLVVNSSLF